jgi:hypothetical protein
MVDQSGSEYNLVVDTNVLNESSYITKDHKKYSNQMHVLFRLYVCVICVNRERHNSSFTNMTQKPLKTKAQPSLETPENTDAGTQRSTQMTRTLSKTAVETSVLAIIHFVSLEDLYCSPGVKRPGPEAYLSVPFSTEVKDDCICTFIPAVSLHVVHR